jgi:hypothetical protein
LAFRKRGTPAIPQSGYNRIVQKKIFWITFAALGLVADLTLPFWWAIAATIPILFASWWFAYRSDWF